MSDFECDANRAFVSVRNEWIYWIELVVSWWLTLTHSLSTWLNTWKIIKPNDIRFDSDVWRIGQMSTRKEAYGVRWFPVQIVDWSIIINNNARIIRKCAQRTIDERIHFSDNESQKSFSYFWYAFKSAVNIQFAEKWTRPNVKYYTHPHVRFVSHPVRSKIKI